MASTAKIRSFFLFRWIYDLRLSRKLSLLIWLYLFIIILLIGLNSASTRSLSAIRAFVGAEGLWSKAQKEAVFHLLIYAQPGDTAGHYELFRQKLSVHKGDMEAWTELQKESPDISRVLAGFVRGGNSPEDVEDMLWLYTWFRKVSYAQKAIGIWNRGALLMEDFENLAEELHRERSGPSPNRQRIASLSGELEALDARLTVLAEGFSSVFGDMARRLNSFFSFILLVVRTFFLLVAMLLSFLISKRIRDGVNAVREGAERVGKGDFSSPVEVFSRDELGVLASDFNAMTGKLERALQEIHDKQGMLMKSEEKYRFLVENIPHGIFYKDRDSVYVGCNTAMALDLGVGPADCAGKTDFDFFPPSLAVKYREDDRLVMDQGAAMGIDETYVRGGQERLIHTVKAPIRDDTGRIVGILGVFWDITERKRTEELLRERIAFEKTALRISSRLNLSVDDDAFFAALSELGNWGRAERAHLLLFNKEGSELGSILEWCADGVSPGRRELRSVPAVAIRWWMGRYRTAERGVIMPLSSFFPEQWKETGDALAAGSLLVLPLTMESRITGFIGFDNPELPLEESGEGALLQIIAETIAAAVGRRSLRDSGPAPTADNPGRL